MNLKRRIGIALFFGLCFVVFSFFRLRQFSYGQPEWEVRELTRPQVPSKCVNQKEDPLGHLPLPRHCKEAETAFEEVLEHPWVASQPEVSEISFEMVRDLAMLKACAMWLCQESGSKLSEPDVTTLFLHKVQTAQEDLPFSMPREYYSVACIEEAPNPTYHTYQRLYLGQLEVGLPFYLDVRVFKEAHSPEKIIAWHRSRLKEGASLLLEEVSEATLKLIQRGNPSESVVSATHGFASEEEERGQFIYAIERGGNLYLAIAEAPWEVFERFIPVFEKIQSKQ